MEAKDIKYIVIHCTAGYAPAERVQAYFLRPVKKGGRGWNTGGYHRIIDRDGTINEMYPFDKVTNGVKGFNKEAIHISYVGGIENNKAMHPKDTRNKLQKEAIIKCINEARFWLEENGKDITKDLQVVGHRDFSHDANNDNVIQSWERMKECPSFDAIEEYKEYSSEDTCGLLPEK